jgi:hypothetical protein
VNSIRSAGMASGDRGAVELDRELLRDQVRARWVDALGHDRFSDDDDFFDVGGHSLLIADIMAKLGALTGRRLSLRLFFDNPTVNELTDALVEAGASRSLTP